MCFASEFLSGFHKRKLQRKKEAKDKFENDLKQERKRIKAEAKESYKKMVLSHKAIPELENLLSQEYEEEDANVKVVELSTDAIAKKYHWIGANKPITRDEKEPLSENENIEETEECPGMEFNVKKKTPSNKTEQKSQFESEKDVKRALKKQAVKTVKKSKVFQMKNKLEQQKQKKKSFKLKRQRIKLREKKSYGPHKRFKTKKSGKNKE